MATRIEKHIAKISDQKLLDTIITAAQARLDELKKKDMVVYLVCQDNEWVANLPLGTIQLGTKLTPPEVLSRSQQKPPGVQKYELSKEEADRRRETNLEMVGWWEVKDEQGLTIGHRFYSVPEYDKAKTRWKRWKQLADDPLAMAYGIPIEGMEKIKELEGKGYTAVVK